jgi:hypothetical protein
VPVAHTYNPSYSRNRNQGDCRSKLVQAKGLRDSISKNSITKKKTAGVVAQDVGPEFKPQYHKKEKKNFNVLFTLRVKTTLRVYTLAEWVKQ